MKLLAGLYARVSLEEQATNYSLPSQIRACKKLAAEKGFATSDEATFIDEGGLGGELDRVALTRLRDAARSGLLGAVVVHDPDRLSRKLAHLLLLTEEFEKQAIPLLFVNGAVDATPEGKMFLSMRGAFSEFERLKIAERFSRGRREKAQQGYRVGGKPPFGYAYVGKKQAKRGELVVIPQQAETVRRIFRMSDDGARLLEIARRLTADGEPTVSGRPWTKATLARMLRNTAYIGQSHYNRTQADEPTTRRKPPAPGKNKRTGKRRRPESEWIAYETPPIVDPVLFERVQVRLARDRHIDSGRPSPYMLRGLLKCGACGFSLLGRPGGGSPSYRCGNVNRLTNQRLCPQRSVPLKVLEHDVWQAVVDTFEKPARLWELMTVHWDQLTISDKKAQRECATLKRRIEDLKRREFRAAKAMLDADLADHAATFRADLKATQTQRRTLEARLSQFTRIERPAFNLEAYCHMVEGWRELKKPEPRRTAIRQLVEKIEVEEVDVREVRTAKGKIAKRKKGEIQVTIHFRLGDTNCINSRHPLRRRDVRPR